jgi:putative transposase
MTATVHLLNRDDMERRRLEGARDLLDGLSQSQVARKFGVSRTTASRWRRALDSNGVEALRKRKASGRPTRLTPGQFSELNAVYAAGPQSSGFAAARWTTRLFALAIEERFGVRYDPDHVGRLIHKLGLRAPDSQSQYRTVYPMLYHPGTPEISPTVA